MRKQKKPFILLVLFLFTLVSVAGCTSSEKRKPFDTSSIFWPKLPDPTRVRFIRQVRSDLSVRERTKEEKYFGLKPKFVFRKPSDVVLDKRGNVYVSDLANVYVATFNLEKKTGRILPLKGFHNPLGLAYNEKLDWLAVVSPPGKEIVVFQLPSLKKKLTINSDSGVKLINPVDAAIDAERGRIYVTDSKAGYIRVYDLDGKYLSDIGRPGSDEISLFAPTFMTLDKDGNIYVVEQFAFRFHVFKPDGESLTTVGQLGTAVGNFSRPKGIALDEDGLIYVADAAFGNVQIFDLEGNVYLFFGTTGKLPGYFQIPEGMFIDKNNRLFVADQRNARVQIFQIYSDKYYQEHPEEAAKFSEPAVTVIPEKPEKAEGEAGEEEAGKEESISTPTEETAPEEPATEDVWEEPVMEESLPAIENEGSSDPMMEESQPASEDNGSSGTVTEESQPSPAEESTDTSSSEESPSSNEEEAAPVQ